MAPHSSTLAWKIPWTEEPGRLQSWGREESDMTERLHFHFSLSFIGEGNGNPLPCSCLKNPRDGGAWWAAIYGVARSRTRLKRLSSSSRRPFISLTCMTWTASRACLLILNITYSSRLEWEDWGIFVVTHTRTISVSKVADLGSAPEYNCITCKTLPLSKNNHYLDF